jgi:hypothetical protein
MSENLVEPTSTVMDTWYRTGLASFVTLSSHFMR